MPTLVSSFMTDAEIESLGQKMFEEITAVYEVLSREQLAALRAGEQNPDEAPTTEELAERQALRELLSYTQARFCRLNFITPRERETGSWLPIREARKRCHVFGNAADDARLIDEAIELNLLPVFECEGTTLVDTDVFDDWHDATAKRLKAGRPETYQYGFSWVREEAA